MLTQGLTIILYSLLPAVLYSFIIYIVVPYKTIKFKTALSYLFMGFLSVAFLKYFWVIYPDWLSLTRDIAGNPKTNYLQYYHTYFFVQVGFIEELSKLGIFLIYEKYRRRTQSVKDHPVAVMFYVAMISLGFAVIENISYGLRSADPINTLWWRSITAVIAHMVFGLFMGYWIALGRIGARVYDRSLFDLVINKRKKLRYIVFTLVGLLSASILHGIYDLHIELLGVKGITGLYTLLIMSLLGAFWCFKHLNKLHKIKVKKLEEGVA